MRRSVRFFSHDPVHYSVLEDCIRAAATAPSGMHAQPWTFLVVQDAGIKRQLREAVEAKERENGERRVAARAKRASERWLVGVDRARPERRGRCGFG